MPSISFNGLQKVVTTNNYTFSDVHLDFNNPIQKDVALDYDGSAIVNSLINLFNTMPGQDLLNPEYGLNLVQFVFQPATDTTAYLIGKTIMENVTVFEPRVAVKNMDIKVNTDEQTFTITLSIVIPSLNAQINLPGVLTKNGFSLLT